MFSARTVAKTPILAPVLVVCAVLSPVLVAFEPVGGDADLMYRPIKEELARTLHAGTLPFWSDLFGLGIPLIAESHVAAFYPPNWVFYRLFDVSHAYRVSMWLHYVALTAATYGYARVLGCSTWGAVATAIGFSLCGFQAVHAIHEPFFTLMPYLPLCLLLADRYVATGRRCWLAGLALAWGIQVTIGHFQIQMWTAGLVVATGVWKILSGGLPRLRLLGLLGAIAWGALVAATQLAPTWQLVREAGFTRAPQYLANYLFPVAHSAQWALPAPFLGRQPWARDPYWASLRTTSEEACAYVGVVPLILSCVGLIAARRDRPLTIWRWIVPLTFALATLPEWWPRGFEMVVQLPGLGWFRAPARYTLMTSLGLLLLAGRGLDRSISKDRFRVGITLAVILGTVAWAWTIRESRNPLYRASLGENTLWLRFAFTALAWILGLASVLAWRAGRISAWGPLAVMTLELGGLFFNGPIAWGWSLRLPEASPILARLREEPQVGLIAGRLQNLPARVGLTPAYPSLGITAPPPNFLLESTLTPPGRLATVDLRWHRRFGVSHGIWAEGDDTDGLEIIAELRDPALQQLLWDSPSLGRGGYWKLVRYPAPAPPAQIAILAHQLPAWPPLFATLSANDLIDEAWFLYGEGPLDRNGPRRPFTDYVNSLGRPTFVDIENGKPARSAQLLEWDGRAGAVEHDGTCYLIIRRTYFPGWFYRINDGPEQPVFKVNGGLQAVPLTGKGTSRVRVAYHPTALPLAVALALAGATAVPVVIGLDVARARQRSGLA